MELINIIETALEVPASKRVAVRVPLSGFSDLEHLTKRISQAQSDLLGKGLDRFRLRFYALDGEDGGKPEPWCEIQGSRLETPEEVDARVRRQEGYNKRQIEEHKARVDASLRQKEIKRILGNMTLDELRAASPLKG